MNRTATLHEDQISTSQKNCKRCVPFPRRKNIISRREKINRLQVCIFREDENMHRKTYLSDMSGVLDKLKASLRDQNSSIVNFYDTIKCFEMEMKF
jgi:hypothetical protein